MAWSSIYLVVEYQHKRFPVIHIKRNNKTLDHVVFDRARNHKEKATYHGNGHTHFQDPEARLNWKDEAYMKIARERGWKRWRDHRGYRGSCFQGLPVGLLDSYQHIVGFQYRNLETFLDSSLYGRTAVKNFVLYRIKEPIESLHVDVFLCPQHASTDLARAYKDCIFYRDVTPFVAFCINQI